MVRSLSFVVVWLPRKGAQRPTATIPQSSFGSRETRLIICRFQFPLAWWSQPNVAHSSFPPCLASHIKSKLGSFRSVVPLQQGHVTLFPVHYFVWFAVIHRNQQSPMYICLLPVLALLLVVSGQNPPTPGISCWVCGCPQVFFQPLPRALFTGSYGGRESYPHIQGGAGEIFLADQCTGNCTGFNYLFCDTFLWKLHRF